MRNKVTTSPLRLLHASLSRCPIFSFVKTEVTLYVQATKLINSLYRTAGGLCKGTRKPGHAQELSFLLRYSWYDPSTASLEQALYVNDADGLRSEGLKI